METDINTKINLKADAQDFVKETNKLHARFKTGQEKEPEPKYILTELILIAKKNYNKTMLSGKSYCHDCSRNGNRVEHFNDQSYQEYINRPIIKKYGKELNRLNEIIF